MANSVDGTRSVFEPLLELDMEVGVFGSDWAHCDQISTYVARMVSHNRADSLLYTNLFSSALNELLETAFRVHGGGGAFRCRVGRSGPVDRIEITIPCGAETAGFYRKAMEIVAKPDAADRYREALLADGPLDPNIGLLELAVDYAAELAVDETGDGAIRLVTDLALEDAED